MEKVEYLKALMSKKGYAVFENDTKPFNLNIVGVRNSDPTINKFNDYIATFWKYEGRWSYFECQATTLPGLKYMEIKEELVDTIISFFEKNKSKKEKLLLNIDEVDEKMRLGKSKAQKVAQQTLEKVKSATGLL